MDGRCNRQEPELLEVKKDHWASCLLYSP